jgi:ABC-type Fe3+-siderophore transport system permease subunit
VSRPPVPGIISLGLVTGVALVVTSDALGLYDRIPHWGKLVHGVEAFLITAVGGLLLLAYRDRERFGIHTHILALTTICIGVTFGAFWEFIEFLIDWMFSSDLQKSNADTMTDFLWNDLAAVLATLVAFRTYHHLIDAAEKRKLGDLSASLFTPIGYLLDRHGKLLAAAPLLLIAVYLAALWFAERPVPFIGQQ